MDAVTHLRAAYQFLDAAGDYSIAAAPLIRSEMLWCATAHNVKAAANHYGWTNASHRDLFRVVSRLQRRLSEPLLTTEFNSASDLHKPDCHPAAAGCSRRAHQKSRTISLSLARNAPRITSSGNRLGTSPLVA